MAERETSLELIDYWKLVRAHWLALITITLIGTACGFAWSYLQPNVYTANASGIVSVGVSSDLGSAMAGENYAKSRVNSYLDLATSRSVAESAIEELNIDDSPDALVSRVSATNPMDTATLNVSAEAGTPEEARDLAEAWISAIGSEVTELENSGDADSDAQSIVSFQSLDSAQLPSSPSSPNTELALAIGTLVGFILAFVYALLRNIFDRRVRSSQAVENETGKSVIGTIPFHKTLESGNRLIMGTGGNDRSDRGSKDYAVAEALRELRTNLQFMNVDNPPRRIVVSSAIPGEGKSTIIANLAGTVAASGQKVIVVDCDLRRPVLAKTFGLVESVGLTDVLIGRAEINDVLQPWGETGNLFVLGAGKVPPNPSELLASNALHNIIDELAENAVVLLDAPPLLPVTDAAILTARTDGALIVTRAGKTTYDALKSAVQNLEKISGHTLGIIINGVPQKGAQSAGYGYRYHSYYGRKDSPAMQDEPMPDRFPTPPTTSATTAALSDAPSSSAVAPQAVPRRQRRRSES